MGMKYPGPQPSTLGPFHSSRARTSAALTVALLAPGQSIGAAFFLKEALKYSKERLCFQRGHGEASTRANGHQVLRKDTWPHPVTKT